ncbi:MAG: hypothetical protein K2J12_09050, partial [Muribaculaceae bacterium]|nr:hypothetical protein [Muribaculaceae bacterium]
MKQLYDEKWIVLMFFGATSFFTFVTLFAGASAIVNRFLLIMNILLIIMQLANVVFAFRNSDKGIGVALILCFILSIALMWAMYLWGWNYTVKALT